MAQSLCKIYLHIIFHIKTTSPTIQEDDLDKVHSYIGQLVNRSGCTNMWVNGTNNHVHVLCLLGRETSVSHLVEELKRNSSRWVKTLSDKYKNFEWQGGYGAFSISQSIVDKTLTYIKNQKDHHKKISFREEYKEFLRLYDVKHDEKYVFIV